MLLTDGLFGRGSVVVVVATVIFLVLLLVFMAVAMMAVVLLRWGRVWRATQLEPTNDRKAALKISQRGATDHAALRMNEFTKIGGN